MTAKADSRINFKAIDNVSGVVDRISSKFPKLTKVAMRSSKAFDRIDKSSAKLRGNLKRVGGGMKSVGVGMTAGLTLPIVAFGAAAFKASAVFDKSMNKVESLTGASEDQLKSLRVEAKKLGSTTAFSASQAADAMAFFGQAGWDTNQILKATAPTLALASASGTDLAKTADIMSNVMGGFNLKATEAGTVADVLAKATAKGNINMEMIGESMKDAAPVAQKYGASIQEVAALTAKLGDAGIQGSKAGTTLKNMFLKLAAPTAGIKKTFKELGVQAVDKTTGKMRKMTDILVDMNRAFKAKGLSSSKKLAILDKVFGKRAIAGAGVLLNAVEQLDPKTGKLINTVKVLENGLIDSAGAAKKMQDINEKGLPGSINSIKSAWESVLIAVMDSGIKEFLVIAINKVAEFFRWISNLNPAILKWAAIIAGVVAVMGPLIFILGGAISALPFLITGFEAMVVLFPALNIGMKAFMMTTMKMTGAIGLLALSAIMVYENWAPIKSFFADFFTDPLQQIKDMVDWVGKLTNIGSFFGDDSDDIDAKLKAQGFKIKNAAPQGEATKSEDLTKQNFEFKQRKQQASVDIKFADLPQGSKVMSEDKEGLLNIDTGMMGAI